MSKPAIPDVPVSSAQLGRMKFDTSVKQTLEQLTGRRGGGISELPVNASTSDIIAKINEIIQRLQ